MKTFFSPIIVKNINDFEHSITHIEEIDLHDEISIVIRVEIALWTALLKQKLDASFEAELIEQIHLINLRLKKIDVFIVPDAHTLCCSLIDHQYEISPRLFVAKDGLRKPLSLIAEAEMNQICNDDLQWVFDNSRDRSVIRATNNYHFALPSGAHTSQFVRLSESFTDIETVDRIAYWIAVNLLKKVEIASLVERGCLVFDHPSMLILGARVQKIIDLDFYSIKHYPVTLEERTSLSAFMNSISKKHKSINFLVGIASTGKLCRMIEEWAKDAGLQLNLMVLYTAPNLSSAVCCEVLSTLCLPDYEHFSPEENCKLCEAESANLAINGTTYLISHLKPANVSLTLPYFDLQREFLKKYGGNSGVLKVHYDAPNERNKRHHSFYVDVDALLDIKEFNCELMTRLCALDFSPDLILLPDNNVCRRIGLIANYVFSCRILYMDVIGLNLKEDLFSFKNVKRILFIDDIFITGSSLDGCNKFFRSNSDFFTSLKCVYFFTPIAMPSSNSAYKKRVRGLISHNSSWEVKLDHLYSIFLPHWNMSSNCPWCKEQKIIKQLSKNEDFLDSDLSVRDSVLSDRKSGLVNNFFWSFPSLGVPALGGNSYVMSSDAAPIQVLFSCASALQQLRHSSDASLCPDGFPVPSYLAERVFSNNFTEELIWISLIRSLISCELEQELKNYLMRKITEYGSRPNVDYYYREMALAALCGKFGRSEESDYLKLFFSLSGIEWQLVTEGGYLH